MAARKVDRRSLPILVGGEALRTEAERPRSRSDKFHPQTVPVARQRLTPQVQALSTAIRALGDSQRAESVLFQATLLPNYWASSYFPQELIDDAGLRVIGTRIGHAPYETPATPSEDRPAKSLLLAGPDSAIGQFARYVSGTSEPRRRSMDQIREFYEIRLPEAAEVVKVSDRNDPDEDILCEAVLHNDLGSTGTVYRKWRDWVSLLQGDVEVERVRAVGGLLFVPTRVRERHLDRIALFNPRRVIRRSPRLRPLRPTRARVPAASPDLPPWHAQPASDYRVAVFDGGFDAADPYLQPFARVIDLTTEPTTIDDLEHGTIVTTTALFGAPVPGRTLPIPPTYIDHYRVLPVPRDEDDFDAIWILDRIVETLEQHRYPIVNLSLGPELAVDDGEPHRWTAELDRLAKEQGTLFVVAAGNNGELDETTGLNRILVPGDAINGITVGAADRPEGPVARASFSPIGPGRPGARVKPTGLSFGGNSPSHAQTWLGPNGEWLQEDGTSFSAPRVLHGLAGLLVSNVAAVNRLNTLRAFAVHFADGLKTASPDCQSGYGLLRDDYQRDLVCGPNEVTVLYEDRIERDEVAGFVLPVPLGLEQAQLDIRWTVVMTAPVSPADGAEYSQAGLEVFFRPHSQIYEFWRDDTLLGSVNVADDPTAAARLIREGGAQSPNPAAGLYERRRLPEDRQREAGKWETIVAARRGARTRGLHHPRLDIAYLARRGRLLKPADAEGLDVSVLVSVRARRGVDLYSAVRTQFPVLVPAGSSMIRVQR